MELNHAEDAVVLEFTFEIAQKAHREGNAGAPFIAFAAIC